jgi:cytochrome o ubiquinol oxidase subunit 2
MKRHRRWFVIPVLFGVLAVPIFFATRFIVINFRLFKSAGTIAEKEHNLMIIAILLMLLVIIPVIILVLSFAWHYRAGNSKAKYLPNWDHAKTDELIWWAIPFEIILVLASITWTSTHELDPWKPLESDVKPVVVQVVALDWKWLFIYPEEGIASVNELEIPAHTPINFELTADAPMNSFWIPQLGGQIMVMTGMVTKLHLDATQTGTYNGTSANFSGEGFSGMNFPVHAVSDSEYRTWVNHVKVTSGMLDDISYIELAKQSKNVPAKQYVLTAPNLFTTIVNKYMDPDNMEGMDMGTASVVTPAPTASSSKEAPMEMDHGSMPAGMSM